MARAKYVLRCEPGQTLEYPTHITANSAIHTYSCMCAEHVQKTRVSGKWSIIFKLFFFNSRGPLTGSHVKKD
jgi:hypothetical protein